MPGTAVIIPYFQHERGVLATAIRSALAQVDAGPLTVVVCDDDSPVPAELELAQLTPAERDHVILVRQANAGPGPARNAALDAVPPGTDWIAFLDSDDHWGPLHIARAVEALSQGYDLFFANALREPEVTTHFQNAAFDPARHTPVGTLPDLFALSGDFLTLNIAMSPVSISTVVMRASSLGDMRFPPMAFEDLMYWFEAARRGARVAFDGTLQVRYGRGNITLTDHWVSQHELKNVLSYHRIFMRVAREFTLAPEQRTLLDRRISLNRKLFAHVAVGLLYRRMWPVRTVVTGFLALDPKLVGALLRAAATELGRRLPFGRRAAVAG